MCLQQLMSIHPSKLHHMECGESMYLEEIKTINEALSLCKPLPHILSNLITCITKPLLSLGVNGLHDLTNRSGTRIILIAQLQSKLSKVSVKRKVALNRLAALVNLPSTTDLTAAVILKNKNNESQHPFCLLQNQQCTHQRTYRHPPHLPARSYRHHRHKPTLPTNKHLSSPPDTSDPPPPTTLHNPLYTLT